MLLMLSYHTSRSKAWLTSTMQVDIFKIPLAFPERKFNLGDLVCASFSEMYAAHCCLVGCCFLSAVSCCLWFLCCSCTWVCERCWAAFLGFNLCTIICNPGPTFLGIHLIVSHKCLVFSHNSCTSHSPLKSTSQKRIDKFVFPCITQKPKHHQKTSHQQPQPTSYQAKYMLPWKR